MKLITTEEHLRSHIPNFIASVKGETPLLEKLSLFLDLAEDWVINTFTSTSTFNTICGYTDSNNIRILCCRLVVAEALLRAIPSLDIVLTPNGFGVVSNQNVAPASKDRVERLIASLADYRDDCIANLLPHLVGASQWLNSEQAQFFGATLFPDLSVCDSVPGKGGKWQRYLELRSSICDFEDSLAEDFFSPELVARLREQNLRRSLPTSAMPVVNAIRAQVIEMLKGQPISMRRMIDTVNIIRNSQISFPEWHSSATAKLFSSIRFENNKENKGYWF